MTLTDEGREAIRWFAERCLGWTKYMVMGGSIPLDTWDEGTQGQLTGWPGFGRVVEYVTKSEGWNVAYCQVGNTAWVTVFDYDGQKRGEGEHDAPDIAAVLALRQAKEAGR